MEEDEIRIYSVKNGYRLKINEFNENSGEYKINQYVFEIKDPEHFNTENQFCIPIERVQTFLELVEFLENRFGLEGFNHGDYYLHKQIKQTKKSE